MKEDPKMGIQFGFQSFRLIEEPLHPPPPGFISPFKTLIEWLSHICDTNPQGEPVYDYNFAIWESANKMNNHMICFAGYNIYRNTQGDVVRSIVFKPAYAFFLLPNEDYGNLSKQKLKNEIEKRLVDFTRSNKFQNSFMSKVKSILINFDNQIWPIVN